MRRPRARTKCARLGAAGAAVRCGARSGITNDRMWLREEARPRHEGDKKRKDYPSSDRYRLCLHYMRGWGRHAAEQRAVGASPTIGSCSW